MSVRQILDSTGKVAAAYLPTFIQNDLAAPVVIQAEAPATAGNVEFLVNGDQTSVYGGGITINPGRNNFAPQGAVGLNIHAGADGVNVEVGTDGGPGTRNFLHVAGAEGLGEVYDSIYNPVQPYVDSNPGEVTTNPEPINNASLYNSIRSVPLGNTPASYNYFKMFLDLNATIAYNEGTPRIRIYLSDTENGAYDATKATTTWVQPADLPSGSPIALSDIPLIYHGVVAGGTLYVNITFANDPVPNPINCNLSPITTDYSVEASIVLSM